MVFTSDTMGEGPLCLLGMEEVLLTDLNNDAGKEDEDVSVRPGFDNVSKFTGGGGGGELPG